MSENVKDAAGNPVNRLAHEAAISPLAFLRGIGWPIYRLQAQLRMAAGLFELCHGQLYNDLDFRYGPKSVVDEANHSTGLQLEAFLRKQFPAIKAPPAGTLREAFIHCEGTKAHKDEATRSTKNQKQNLNALDFIRDLVKETKIKPAQISIITPYKLNADALKGLLKRSAYVTLEGLPTPATIDSFQGQENDIIVVVLAVTQASGPGFITNENRLNVMLSRQRSGLVIFGDIGMLSGSKGKQLVKGAAGATGWANVTMLLNVVEKVKKDERVGRLPPRADAAPGAKEGQNAGKQGNEMKK
jgi:hypothetical protein